LSLKLEKCKIELSESLSENNSILKEIADIKTVVNKSDSKKATLENAVKDLRVETETLENEAKHNLKTVKVKEEVKNENLSQTNRNYQNEIKIPNDDK
jgi:hypothetical protein